MTKEGYIAKYGEVAYEELLTQNRKRYRANAREINRKTREKYKNNEKPRCATIILKTGGFKGKQWTLRVSIAEGTKNFQGNFQFYSKEHQLKRKLRHNDREFCKARMFTEFMDNHVLHHDWEDKDGIYWVRLLNKSEHQNGCVGSHRSKWIEKEEWLKCMKPERK